MIYPRFYKCKRNGRFDSTILCKNKNSVMLLNINCCLFRRNRLLTSVFPLLYVSYKKRPCQISLIAFREAKSTHLPPLNVGQLVWSRKPPYRSTNLYHEVKLGLKRTLPLMCKSIGYFLNK
jgi:hypothetical protein